jgi:coenzyme F420-reducing hydrogenase beta subunit
MEKHYRKPVLADINTCTGCLACVDTCAKKALTAHYNDEGHLTYQLDSALCVECGLCEKACPVVSNYAYGVNTLKDSTPYAAWGQDKQLRSKSSSGGVFAQLAQRAISNGGVVIGASLQNNEVKHIAVDKAEDIYLLQGSKYTQSDTEGIYKVVRKHLQEGRDVLFSGLGCQVAGLLSFLGNTPYKGELYTVDLICGGVPSRFLIDYYLRESSDVVGIVAFRSKQKYEFSVKDKNGQVRVVPLSERPLPLCGFYTELTNRYSCYDCKFNGAHRKSDITIGDYWGDAEYVSEHKEGISVAVAHSEKGRNLLQQADIELREIGWDNFLMHNPRMIDGYKSTSKSKARKNLAKAFKEYPYEKILQVYANKATWHEPVQMFKKICGYLTGRIRGKLYQIKLKKNIQSLHNQ